MKSFWTAFLLIFIAELGDKTQFMTLALSSRYKALTIILGVTVGTMLVSLISVALGGILGNIFPTNLMNIIAGLIFIVFGLFSLKQSQEEEKKTETEYKPNQHFIWLSIAFTFFLAELADKTMFATMAIASADNQYFAIWLGSSAGLIAANSLAIIVGKTLKKYVEGKAVHLISASIFIIAGLFALKSGFLK